jgi:uroporphyrinogen decarboxylase
MNDRLLRALRREPVDCTPVWFMRQAGRSLPKYRETRAERDMFALLRDPPAAAQVTALPLEYFAVDAAVLYNDLSTPYFGAGFDVEMKPASGRSSTTRSVRRRTWTRMTPFDPRRTMDYVMEQIALLVARVWTYRCSDSSARRSRCAAI